MTKYKVIIRKQKTDKKRLGDNTIVIQISQNFILHQINVL